MAILMSHLLQKADMVFNKMQFGTHVRMSIYEKIATYLDAGMDLPTAVKQIYNNMSDDGKKPNHPVAKILRKWQESLANGNTLVETIHDWVPEDEQSILCSGDATNIPSAVEDLMKIQDAKTKIKSAIIGGVSYPIVLFLAGCAFLAMFSVRIAPQFAEVIPRQKWASMPSTMAAAGDFFTHYFLGLALLTFAIIYLVMWSLPRWTGRIRQYFDYIPPWSIYRLYAGSSFMLVLSAMLSAGMTQGDILKIMLRHASPWLRERLGAAQYYVADGDDVGLALHKSGFAFPDKETVRDLRSYASQPGFAEILKKVGTRWLDGAVKRVQGQTNILKYIGMFFAAVVICGFIASIGALELQISAMAQSGTL